MVKLNHPSITSVETLMSRSKIRLFLYFCFLFSCTTHTHTHSHTRSPYKPKMSLEDLQYIRQAEEWLRRCSIKNDDNDGSEATKLKSQIDIFIKSFTNEVNEKKKIEVEKKMARARELFGLRMPFKSVSRIINMETAPKKIRVRIGQCAKHITCSCNEEKCCVDRKKTQEEKAEDVENSEEKKKKKTTPQTRTYHQ